MDPKSVNVEEFGEAFFKTITPHMQSLYIELACVKDFRLGALLAHVKNEDEYKYVLSQLDVYAKAVDNQTMKYFPTLSYTDEQLDTYIQNPENGLRISMGAPATMMMKSLVPFLQHIVETNKNGPHDIPKTQVTFATRGFDYHPTAKDKLLSCIRNIDPLLSPVVIREDAIEHNKTRLLSSDLLMIHDTQAFLHSDVVLDLLFPQEAFLEKVCLMPLRIDADQLKKANGNIDKITADTQLYLDIATTIEFIDTRIPIMENLTNA